MIASERPAELNATAQNPWHVYRVTTMIKQKVRIMVRLSKTNWGTWWEKMRKTITSFEHYRLH